MNVFKSWKYYGENNGHGAVKTAVGMGTTMQFQILQLPLPLFINC